MHVCIALVKMRCACPVLLLDVIFSLQLIHVHYLVYHLDVAQGPVLYLVVIATVTLYVGYTMTVAMMYQGYFHV